jgi:hypothetical protein
LHWLNSYMLTQTLVSVHALKGSENWTYVMWKSPDCCVVVIKTKIWQRDRQADFWRPSRPG